MPLVRISIPAHLTAEKARALADAVDPTFPDVERSADASIVEITLLTGRNDDRKRSLYRAIAAGAVAAGFRSDDVMVALIENGPIDWSLGRGEAYDKHG